MTVSIARSLLLLVCLAAVAGAAHAATLDATTVTADQLSQMEQRAEHADRREQCFLFTELVQIYTQVAARQVAQGEAAEAARSLEHVRAFAERIHLGLARDTKKLKNAEMMLHNVSFRLSEFVHRASDDDKPALQATLAKLDHVHEEMLAQVFAH